MHTSSSRGLSRIILTLTAALTMVLAGLAMGALAAPASASDPVGQGSCPAGYTKIGSIDNLGGVQSIPWDAEAEAAAVHSGGGVDPSAFKTFYKPEPITAWNPNKPGNALLGLSNVVWCDKDQPKPVDLCPTLDGIQTEYPYSGSCTNPDLCPTLEGIQTEYPYSGSCTNPDLCPTLEGIQTTYPYSGSCTETTPPGNPSNPPASGTPGSTGATSTEVAGTTSAAAPAAATVPAPAAATVAAPAPATVAVPAAATLPAGVPAGEGSQAPGLPTWVLALMALGVLGAAVTGSTMAARR